MMSLAVSAGARIPHPAVAVAEFSINDASDAAVDNTPFVLTVTRSARESTAVSVQWTATGTGLFNGTEGFRRTGGDYSGVLDFASGELTKTIDFVLEVTAGTSFQAVVTLSDPSSGSVIIDSTGTLAAATSDPFFDDVVLLMHFEGAVGTRPVVDVKGHAGAWHQVNDPGDTGTPSGLTITAPLMGTSSVRFAAYSETASGGTASGALIAMDADADFALAGDFTIEFRIKPNGVWRNALGTRAMLGTIGDSTGVVVGDWSFRQTSSGALGFLLSTTSGSIQLVSGVFGGTDVETVIAAVRSGDTLMLFSGGAMVASAIGAAGTTLTGAHAIGIGAAPDWASTIINDQGSGIFDEVRITAAARYTAAGYAVATQPFPDL